MSDIDDIIDSIKDKSLDEVKKEFKDLLANARKDSVDFLKEVAANTTRWLTMRAEGQLTESETRALFKSQKKLAQVFANGQTIRTKLKVQKVAYRLLDISIDVLIASL